MIEIGNTSSTTLTANDVIPFTTVFYDTNNKMNFDSTNNAIVVTKSGYYNIGGTFVFTPSKAGNASVLMYVNGVASPTAVSTFTADGTSTYTFTIPSKYIRTIPNTIGSTVPITFVVNADGVLSNANAHATYVPSVND